MIYMRNITITTAKSATYLENVGEIIFAGEEFDQSLLSELMNARAAGKLPLDEYADKLSRAAVGISLMESPHPSYPPLEMASSGCITITNGYENKDMTLRSDNIISLDELSPRGLCSALDKAFSRVRLGEAREFSDIRPVDTTVSAPSARDTTWRLARDGSPSRLMPPSGLRLP